MEIIKNGILGNGKLRAKNNVLQRKKYAYQKVNLVIGAKIMQLGSSDDG